MAVGTGAAGTAMAVPLFQPSGTCNPEKPSVIVGNGPVVRKGTVDTMYYLEKTTTHDWSLLDNASIVADAHETAGHEYHYYSRTSCTRRQAVPLENWWLRPCNVKIVISV